MATNSDAKSTRWGWFRRVATPLAIIGIIWVRTAQELGHQLPSNALVLVAMVLFGLFFWGARPELYLGPTRDQPPSAPQDGGREPFFSKNWLAAIRRNRFVLLAIIVLFTWIVIFSMLFSKALTQEMYLVGLALFATILLVALIWAALKYGVP